MMENSKLKTLARARRHRRIRKNVRGNMDRPRMCIFRSSNHIYAQVVDDERGITLAAASSTSKAFREQMKTGGNIAAARLVGTLIARRTLDKGITKVVFDRGGYLYHGRVKALAEAVREQGLVF